MGGALSGGAEVGVSVRDLFRVKHGLQLLSNGLRLEVKKARCVLESGGVGVKMASRGEVA
jgi:hypothetical protein